MSRCRQCKKKIKWMEVADASGARWIKVDPKTKPFEKHVCKMPEPNSTPLPDPWWKKY